MKPIKLEIEGLHSFETNQVIDFRTLGSRGIFGIFGATGSGKSTILDAIILALYGKVHRSKTNSDFINLKSKQATVVFDFSFIEDGKEKIFSVKRTFKRKAKKPNEADQVAEVMEVGAFGSRQVIEGANKVDNFIINLLGMTDAEFLKCIALPQGEFASILKSKPNERVSIIGNIFDLNKYGQELWEKVKTRTEGLEKDKAVIEGKLAVLGEVDEVALKNSKNDFASLSKEIADSENKLNALVKTEREEREVARLGEELKKVEEVLKTCEELASSITIKKEALKKAKKLNTNKFVFDRTEELSKLIIEEDDEIYRKNEALKAEKARSDEFLCESTQELESVKERIEKSITRIERLRSLTSVEVKLVGLKNSVKEKEQDLGATRTKISAYEKKMTDFNVDRGVKAKEIKELEVSIQELKTKLKGFECVLTYKSLSAFTEELKTYRTYVEQKYEEAVKIMTMAIENQTSLTAKKKELTGELKSIHQQFGLKGAVEELKLYKAVEEAYAEVSKVSKVKGMVEMLIKERLEVATAICAEENKLEKLEADKVKLDLKFKTMEDEILEIKQKLASLQKTKERSLSENGVADVVSRIRIGEACPICKAEVLEKSTPAIIDIMVIDNDILNLNQVLERKEEAKDNILYSIAKTVSLMETVNANIVSLETKQSELKKKLAKLFDLDEDANVLDEEEELKKLEAHANENLDLANKAFRVERSLMRKLQEVNESIIKQNCVSVTARMEVDSYSELLNKLAESVRVKDVEMLALLSQDENLSEKLSKMEELNTELERKLLAKEELVAEASEIDKKLSGLEVELALLKKEEADLTAFLTETEKQIKVDQITLDAETIGGDVSKSIELEQRELEGLRHRETELNALQQERKNSVNNLSIELSGLVNQNKAHKEEHKSLAENVLKVIKELGLENLQEAKLFMMNEEDITALSSSITNFDADYNFAKTRRAELESALNGRVSSSVILDQMMVQIDLLSKEVQGKKEALAKLQLTIEQLETKLKLFNSLTKEFNEIDKEYALTRDLYDLLKGKALLEFIAEEFINDISFMASNKLQVLMDGRYVLSYKNKEFFVIDNFNDGQERAVATLSGGEMFVVSLALALSISDAIASKSNKSVDFFFLDEGFGTLDKEYCEYIVDSLIKLESQNLTIGLISHIPELQEKIIQKLEVVKTAKGTIVKSINDI